jgi:hypothetical protein
VARSAGDGDEGVIVSVSRRGSLCARGGVNGPELAWWWKVSMSLSIDICMAVMVVCADNCCSWFFKWSALHLRARMRGPNCYIYNKTFKRRIFAI